uniref:Uncharacterized protein n=1 Tax=Oryza sativa subsp. japonica TaxID=39947 RepID=Q6YS41_ORYSJ|nr:hypothetical protein [Oryza sativa Japonica Group]
MERMAAAGTGGDGNGVPTTPDHNGGTAEGRQDLGKILERLGREEQARSDQKRRPTAAIRSGAYLDFGKAAHVGFWTEWSGSQGAVERGDAAREKRRLEPAAAAEKGGARGCGASKVERGNGAVDGVRTAAAVPGRATAQCGVNGSGGAVRLEFAGERRRVGSGEDVVSGTGKLGEEEETEEESTRVLYIRLGDGDRGWERREQPAKCGADVGWWRS